MANDKDNGKLNRVSVRRKEAHCVESQRTQRDGEKLLIKVVQLRRANHIPTFTSLAKHDDVRANEAGRR